MPERGPGESLGLAESICPCCKRLLDAELLERDGRVILSRTCPGHGRFDAVVYGDAGRYRDIQRFDRPGSAPLERQTEVTQGCPHDCGIPALAEIGIHIYLQFDGFEAATQAAIRGRDLTAQKLRALERCAEAGVTVSLAAAVERGFNEHEVGAILAFGVEHAAVTGVFFQPVTHSGRFRPDADPLDKLTNPDARRCRTAPRLPEQPRGARRRGTGRARGAVVGEGGGWLGAGCRAAGLRRLRDRHAARELGCRVVGLEYGQRAIDEASDAARAAGLRARVSFRHGDAEALHFESASFDAVLCECALCTFPDKARAAHELRRVLRPGGRLALSDVVVEHSRLSAELRGPLATSDAIDLLARAREAIRDGTLGYAIFIAGD